MMIKEFLQGRPFAHPLHPALVHFPIALFTLSLLLDLASRLGDGSAALVLGAFYTMLGAVGMALLAALTGLADWWDIRKDHPSKDKATAHMVLNLAAVALYAVNLVMRGGSLQASQTSLLPLALSFVGLGLLMFSGFLGGALVYNDGIGAGRHRRRTDLPDETVRPASGVTGGFVSIGNVADLQDQETLRAEVNGHVLAVVNLDGSFYAFQEFCTHRYAPLSEGSFHDHEVQCPWHRSCFDVRTGEVTRGPAKLPLKTFPVEVKDGQICVRVE